MPKLVSIAEVWQARAQVAEAAAAELNELAGAAGEVARANYLGNDCAEGEALHAQVGQVLRSWRSETSEVSARLVGIAANCRAAADLYAAQDEVAADEIGP